MRKFINRFLPVLGLSAITVPAFAAVPAGVTDAITAAGTDGSTIVVGLAAAGAAVYLLAKLLRKFGIML